MPERETTRVIAWSAELRAVHARMRQALDVTRRAVAEGEPTQQAGRDLLLFCQGFCTALGGHHEGEDRILFPALEAVHPELSQVLRTLTQDHTMIAHLLEGLRAAVDRAAAPAELQRHLDGVAAIMENHFRYEERQLLALLEELELHAPVTAALGPL